MGDPHSRQGAAHNALATSPGNLDAPLAKNAHTLAVDAWMWITHADHDLSKSMLEDDARARRRSTMERAWFESGVHRRPYDAHTPVLRASYRCNHRMTSTPNLGVHHR